jgi:PKD repeat protein
MMRNDRVPVSLLGLAAAAVLLWLPACSSGLGDAFGVSVTTAEDLASSNERFGFDPGFEFDSPITGGAVAGAVFQNGTIGESLVFFAYTTQAAADDADGTGAGNKLEFEGSVTEGNSSEQDVFLALVRAEDIDPNAFTQTIAQKFRHPRCVTCHSMNTDSPPNFAFANIDHLGGQPPLNDLSSSECTKSCHAVNDWRAPPPELDFRQKTLRELFDMIQNPPPGILTIDEHFVGDPRVAWALSDGRLPLGRIADDDRDGVTEPEDSDGVIRTVPGGQAAFNQQLQSWLDNGRNFGSPGAVKDLLLVSRQSGQVRTGDGASFSPKLCFLPNDDFPETDQVNLGTVFVVFASDATNLVAGDTNAVRDIFRAEIRVRVDRSPVDDSASAGEFNLQLASMTRVSVRSGGSQVNDASDNPSIGGDQGQFIAFESLATDLISGFSDNNGGSAPDIYLHNAGAVTTTLISRTDASATSGANNESTNPSVSSGGDAVAFESRATDLFTTTDTNGDQDVFFALVSGNAVSSLDHASVRSDGTQGSGADCHNPSVAVRDFANGDVIVTFESEKTNLVPALPALSTTNVYLRCAGAAPSTVLLNQRIDNQGVQLGTAVGGTVAVNAHSAILGPDGTFALYVTDADNLDVNRDLDTNRADDVMIVNVDQFLSAGLLLPFRLSVTIDGGDSNGASSAPTFGQFVGNSDFTVGFSSFPTQADNLGTTGANNNHLILFIDETAGAVANFSVDATSGLPPLEVDFTNTSPGDPTTFAWDFGDGNTSTEENPTHTYTDPGRYSVTLMVDGADGPATVTKTDLIAVFGAVTADFTVDVVSGEVPLNVQFTDLSEGAPTTFLWDFGDGNTSTLQNPTHKYTTLGPKTVTLTVTGALDSDSLTIPDVVTVTPGTLGTIITDIFANDCFGCHDTAGGQGPNLEPGANGTTDVHNRIVNVRGVCGEEFVNPFSTATSLLFKKLDNDFSTQVCGAIMPEGRPEGTPYDADKKRKIESWILAGAPDDP